MRHLRDEADAHFLYDALARLTPSAEEREVFEGLADVERRHIETWRRVFAEHGLEVDVPRPSLRARVLLALARRFGPRVLLGLLLREETGEVRDYLSLHRDSTAGVERDSARTLARESAEHVAALNRLAGGPGEPWHQAGAGGYLRNVVYGFNDGLTANFGLVAGVIGASVPHAVIVLSGVAGAVADALSMGASGYLAARSELEVHENEIAMEREEIALMPELEREELALIYRARGMSAERAAENAADVMRDPGRALDEKVREELGIGQPHATPWREAWVTGTATAVGAVLPVLPFLAWEGRAAAVTSFVLAMAMHFAVGAARSIFTGRPLLRSGLDMFVVGFSVAAVGYAIGDVLVRALGG